MSSENIHPEGGKTGCVGVDASLISDIIPLKSPEKTTG